MLKLRRALVVGAVALAPFALGAQQVITFDDVTSPTQLSAGYAGFDWRRFTVVNGTTLGAGYANAVESPDNVAFGSGEEYISTMSSSSLFTFNSGYFTSAFEDGATMTVKGYTSPVGYPPPEDPFPYGPGAEQFFAQFVINTEAPLFVQLDWAGIYRITFTSHGGTAPPPSHEPGGDGYFAVDNIAVNYEITPEPSGVVLIATGLGLLAVRRRRARRG